MMFSLPKDMKFFRETTLGHTVVMGGKTLRSFPNQKPLKNRVNIVISRGQVRDDCIIVPSYERLFDELKARKNEEIFVIGGAMFYRTMLPYCESVLVTKVKADGGAQVFFENLDAMENWSCVSESQPVYSGEYELCFTEYRNSAVKNFIE